MFFATYATLAQYTLHSVRTGAHNRGSPQHGHACRLQYGPLLTMPVAAAERGCKSPGTCLPGTVKRGRILQCNDPCGGTRVCVGAVSEKRCRHDSRHSPSLRHPNRHP